MDRYFFIFYMSFFYYRHQIVHRTFILELDRYNTLAQIIICDSKTKYRIRIFIFLFLGCRELDIGLFVLFLVLLEYFIAIIVISITDSILTIPNLYMFCIFLGSYICESVVENYF